MRSLGHLAFVLLTLLAVSAGSCDDSDSPTAPGPDPDHTVELPATTTLAVGETVLVEPVGVEITFASVIEDSRCPIDVTCVSPGRAVVALQIGAEGGDVSSLELEVGGPPTDVRGLRIAATALDPQPREGQEIPPEDYRLELALD